jgi:5-formyltetrahydrofolate cyclo-ligase
MGGIFKLEKKFEIRNEVKRMLKNMGHELHAEWSNKIAETLFETDYWQEANTIGLTVSKGFEVDTKSLFFRCWQEKKKTAVPKCDPNIKEMEFREIKSFDQLENVYLDLQEPIFEQTTLITPKEIDLLIVPGICFDRRGHRIGYGGGYFDRYLHKYANVTIALAFSFQIVEEVPIESHDIPVDIIITEKELVECRK